MAYSESFQFPTESYPQNSYTATTNKATHRRSSTPGDKLPFDAFADRSMLGRLKNALRQIPVAQVVTSPTTEADHAIFDSFVHGRVPDNFLVLPRRQVENSNDPRIPLTAAYEDDWDVRQTEFALAHPELPSELELGPYDHDYRVDSL